MRPLCLEDKPVFDLYFSTCHIRLSDYTFANSFIWRESIHLRWRVIGDCLCVFANGDGGLTMLFPPLGPGDVATAIRACLDICEDYNARAHLEHWTRVEYVSQEYLERFPGGFHSAPMSGDYIYETARMIDLAGGDLASKRQARNRFARRYAARTEALEKKHIPQCMALLAAWQQQAETHPGPQLSVAFKRSKEISATADCLVHAEAMGLQGMVLFADDQLAGFTLGEMLTDDTCSILIEKTNREFTGSAQFIFSEFCRQYWPHTRWCNVGDDWEVPSLAWTKESYRPAMRIPKWVVRPVPVVTEAPANDGRAWSVGSRA